MLRIPFSYIWRSLWARRLTTVLTLGGVALVVFVFAGVLMLARGLEATLVETGSPDNAIVLRRSAGSELVSQIDRGTASVLETQPEITPAKDGRPLLSGSRRRDQPVQEDDERDEQRRGARRVAPGVRAAARRPHHGRAPIPVRYPRDRRGPEHLEPVQG